MSEKRWSVDEAAWDVFRNLALRVLQSYPKQSEEFAASLVTIRLSTEYGHSAFPGKILISPDAWKWFGETFGLLVGELPDEATKNLTAGFSKILNAGIREV